MSKTGAGIMTVYGFFPGCAYKSAAGYRESVDALNQRLGIQFAEIKDWNCCGATAAFSLDEADGLALCARLFALAQHQGMDPIVTVCNACYTTLRKAGKRLEKDPEKWAAATRTLADQGLDLERPLPAVRHYLDVLAGDVADALQREATAEAGRISSVAVYYGCQYSRPWISGPDAQRPQILEGLLQRLGIDTVDHSARTLCCGASHAVPYADACSAIIQRIVDDIRDKGGQIVTTICPMCQFNLDAGQAAISSPSLPVTYFTQVIGLALGIDPKKLGLHKLLIPLAAEKRGGA
jgi:heterodisulfide reductase subunit B